MKDENHLLIVDDEPDIRLLLAKYAQRNGYIPLTAGDGQEALKIIESQEPAVVISDIMMPVMDGMRLLEEIKARNPNIPVILMTAFGTIDRAVDAMKMGAADFITKPVNLDYLLQIVHRVLKQSELERKVLDHERQLKADLRLASTVQRCMLPEYIDNQQVSLNFRYEPLNEIGGDYLATHLYSEEKIAVALYDVTGHGVSAALLATMLHHELADLLIDPNRPHDIIHKINYYASEKFSVTGLFCTMALIWIDTRAMTVTAINAGHPDILIWRKDQQELQFIKPHIPPIGLQMEEDFEFRLSTVSVSHGDRIILFTDGFTESRKETGEILGDDEFYSIAKRWIGRSPEDCIDGIFREVATFRDRDANDDLTLVVVDIK